MLKLSPSNQEKQPRLFEEQPLKTETPINQEQEQN